MAGEKVAEVREENWQAEVMDAPLPVLVDFWAPRCAPCVAMAPILEQVAEELSGRLKVVKLNVDESRQTAIRYRIQSIPTFLLFQGGTVRAQVGGAMSKAALLDKLLKKL